MSITYTSGIDYQNNVYGYSSKSASKTDTTSNNFEKLIEKSAVDDFNMRHPDHANHVNKQVRNDPKYEAWVIGYLVEDRSIRNPFYAWGNNAGNIISEHFGASIDEHHGQGFSKAVFKGDNSSDDDEEEDWWIKRHKRMKKLLKEQVERTMKQDALQKAALQDEYTRQQYLSAQRRQSFLEKGTPETPFEPTLGSSAVADATAAYTSVIDLFGAMSAPMIDS